MSKDVKFYGYSDDTFGYDGDLEGNHDNCASGEPIVFEVISEGKSFYVEGSYNGTWGIGIRQIDEDIPIPQFFDLVITSSGYTVEYRFCFPNDVVITLKD